MAWRRGGLMLRGLLQSRHCLEFSEAHEEIQDLVWDSGNGTLTQKNFARIFLPTPSSPKLITFAGEVTKVPKMELNSAKTDSICFHV